MADKSFFFRFAHRVSHEAGKPPVFAVAVAAVLVWAITGPLFGFSETWQLIINTGTTIITFLMVFLVQNTQNRDGEAVQAKLDELILVTRASNTFIGAERLTAEELEHLRGLIAEKVREAEERAEGAADAELQRRRQPNTSPRRAAAKNAARRSGEPAAAPETEQESG